MQNEAQLHDEVDLYSIHIESMAPHHITDLISTQLYSILSI